MVWKLKPELVSIQETLASDVDSEMVKKFWGRSAVDFKFIAAIGHSVELLTVWNPDVINVVDVLFGIHSISVVCTYVSSGLTWVHSNLYGPQDRKMEFWDELASIRGYSSCPWLLSGDFNSVSGASDRSINLSDCELRPLDLIGAKNKLVAIEKGSDFSRVGPATPMHIQVPGQSEYGLTKTRPPVVIQADEAFSEAWLSDVHLVNHGNTSPTRSKVFFQHVSNGPSLCPTNTRCDSCGFNVSGNDPSFNINGDDAG